MKKKLLIIVFILSLVPLIGMANPNPIKGKFEKSKTIKKEFSVNGDALLTIKSKYGNVDVVSWNENRVVIEVTITVNGNSESKVEDKLDNITVDFESSKSEVTAKTVFGKNTGWKNNFSGQFEVNYKIKMPITNQADLENDYGSISLNELKGKAEINCDYGKVIIGNLFHSNNEINIDYTNNSTIELMNGGSINADYSGLTVEKAKVIDLNADYSNIVFNNIEDLSFNCDYGKVDVNNGNNINGNGDYLSMQFGKVYKSLEIEADYGSIKVEKLMKEFENISIESDYASIKIGLDADISFNFIANLGYADFSFDMDNVTYNEKIIKSTSKYYEGYVNKENTSSKIEIRSDYGGVKFYSN